MDLLNESLASLTSEHKIENQECLVAGQQILAKAELGYCLFSLRDPYPVLHGYGNSRAVDPVWVEKLKHVCDTEGDKRYLHPVKFAIDPKWLDCTPHSRASDDACVLRLIERDQVIQKGKLSDTDEVVIRGVAGAHRLEVGFRRLADADEELENLKNVLLKNPDDETLEAAKNRKVEGVKYLAYWPCLLYDRST